MSFFLRRFIFIKHTKKQGGYIMRENIKTGIKYLALFGMCFLGGRSLAAGQTVRVDRGNACAFHPLYGGGYAFFLLHGGGCGASAAGRQGNFYPHADGIPHGQAGMGGEKGVFRDMDDAAIRERMEEAFSALPDAAGMNNHMGSAIMEDARSLSAVMEVLKEKGVPFVDSMTTAKSLGKAVAAEKDVALLERDVFLDSTDSVAVVKDNLRKAGEVALEKGSAIAIGHVGPEGGKITAQAIKEVAPELERAGITFVTVSELAK